MSTQPSVTRFRRVKGRVEPYSERTLRGAEDQPGDVRARQVELRRGCLWRLCRLWRLRSLNWRPRRLTAALGDDKVDGARRSNEEQRSPGRCMVYAWDCAWYMHGTVHVYMYMCMASAVHGPCCACTAALREC